MKMRLYALLMQLCDLACADLHKTERHVQRLRVWAWVRATRENLRTCGTRAANRVIRNSSRGA